MGKAAKKRTNDRAKHPYQRLGSRPAASNNAKTKIRKEAPKQKAAPIPFEPDDRILLIGEGDFSFALSLLEHHGCTDVTATTLETREELLRKHPQAEAHIEALEAASYGVCYAIDATKLVRPAPNNARVRRSRYDAIFFNFPHVGGKSTDEGRQVRANQELVVKFLEGAKALLAERGGRILLTTFEGQPYELWGVRNLARHVGLQVARSWRFDKEQYPGYRHVRTLGNLRGDRGWRGEDREARTYCFVRNGEDAGLSRELEKRKKGVKIDVDDDEDDDEDD